MLFQMTKRLTKIIIEPHGYDDQDFTDYYKRKSIWEEPEQYF